MSENPTPLRLGGMALRNGLFVHGPTSWAAAVRTEDGGITYASGRKPQAPAALTRVPLARGVVRVAELFALLPTVRRTLPDARLPFEDGRIAAAMMFTSGATAALRRSRLSPVRIEALSALAALVPPMLALRSRTLAGYHGAEHKTIGAYESGGSPVDTAKEHERCGSHIVAPLLAATTAAQALASLAPAKHRGRARAAGSVAALGVAIEVFAWMDRNRGRPLSRALASPGTALQRFASTREPTPDQLEVAERALDELLLAEAGRAAARA